jgi:hypothetical protein
MGYYINKQNKVINIKTTNTTDLSIVSNDNIVSLFLPEDLKAFWCGHCYKLRNIFIPNGYEVLRFNNLILKDLSLPDSIKSIVFRKVNIISNKINIPINCKHLCIDRCSIKEITINNFDFETFDIDSDTIINYENKVIPKVILDLLRGDNVQFKLAINILKGWN